MCGHAIISLGRYAVDYNLVEPVSPETKVNIQCPCGLVHAYMQYNSETGQTGSVRFHSVPASAFAVDQTIDVGKKEGKVKMGEKRGSVCLSTTPPILIWPVNGDFKFAN